MATTSVAMAPVSRETLGISPVIAMAPTSDNPLPSTERLFRSHERSFELNKFVYPVLSRRSGGISIGVNLNPDKICNFDCIYCQVNRVSRSEVEFVEIGRLIDELEHTLELVSSGKLFEHGKFAATPPALRRLNDIAFSGDGEPTTYRNFDELVERCAAVKRRVAPPEVKMVLITNASMFHRPVVERGLAILDANQGEVWAKLEAGTEAYYKLVERTTIPFQRILDNITTAARVRPLVIQALFMRIRGQAPPPEELAAFCDRLNEITSAGGALSLIQLYTVARQPAESFVTALTDDELNTIQTLVRTRTGLSTAIFGSSQ
jgi:wyosine [tRNA(Phe)-imidazoG37] synthetase (radical SAM superfamily)